MIKMNQLCRVCGESAAGFHFGAFTCEGCKSFFGRTYNNVSSLGECKNDGHCIINKKNRTTCKACRLRKCLLVGMSKSSSRYGRRSNWFKIHCLLEANRASSPNPTANVGSETSSCGRSSEDEIENIDVCGASISDDSPLRNLSSPICSPTSPRRTSSPGLSIPESTASDCSSDINSGYLSLYQRLSHIAIPFSEPSTLPLSPFFMSRFPGANISSYHLDHMLYPNLQQIFPGMQNKLENLPFSRRSIYDFQPPPITSFHRDENNTQNTSPSEVTNYHISSLKRRLPSPGGEEFPSPKRLKLLDAADFSFPIDNTVPTSSEGDRTKQQHAEEQKIDPRESRLIFNIKHAIDEQFKSHLVYNSKHAIEEHPVDLSMKRICKSLNNFNETSETCNTSIILDLSVKSRIIDNESKCKSDANSPVNPINQNISGMQIRINKTDATEGDDTSQETIDILNNSKLNTCLVVTKASNKECTPIDNIKPPVSVSLANGGSVSVSFANGGSACPLNLCLKSLHRGSLISKVS